VIPKKLQYLLALSKESHFARAAAVCHVSQPTLSAGIQQLEAELGIQIVKRGQRFKGFTEEGDIVLDWARRTANECDRLQQRLRDRSGGVSGTLRIGALGSTIPLMRFFTAPLRRLYPAVNLRVTVQNAFDIQQGIEDSALDVAFTYLDKKALRGSRSYPLYTEEYELLIRKGSPLSGQKSAAWDSVKQSPLCLLTLGPPLFGAEVSEILSDALTETPHIITNTIWLVMDHVRTGEWASVLPRPVRIMVSGDRELETIPLPLVGTPPTIGIVAPVRSPNSALVETFYEIATAPETLRKLQEFLGPNATLREFRAPAKPKPRPPVKPKRTYVAKKQRSAAPSKSFVGQR